MGDLLSLDQIGIQIPDEDARRERERVSDLLGTRNLSFPGSQPVSFARKHLKALRDEDYYLCEKTDGIRCLLYLTFRIETDPQTGADVQKETAFLIDRKNDYYFINEEAFHFPLPDGPPDSYHVGTIADGELVLDTEDDGRRVRRFMVFDCLAIDGESIANRSFDVRLGKFVGRVIKPYNALLDQYPEERQYQPFEVVKKDMQKSYGTEMLFKDVIPKLKHGNDGLVFTRVYSDYVSGTDQNIIKWKPPHENTIDFRLQMGLFPPLEDSEEQDDIPPEGIDGHDYEPDYDACPSMTLLVFHGNGRNEHFADLYVTDREWNMMKSMNQMLDGRIIECYKDSQQRWRFKTEKDGTPRFRDDKREANHISTVRSVLESIEDAVSEKQLVDNAKEVARRWKDRATALAKKRQEEEKRRVEDEKKRKAEYEANKRESDPA